MHFTTLSPITVSVNEVIEGRSVKHYLRADDSRFGPMVRNNLIEKYRALTGYEPEDSRLDFEFNKDFLQQRGGVERISKLIQFKETNIKAYQAPIIVEGSIELINLGWESGFGNANSQGFGMIR